MRTAKKSMRVSDLAWEMDEERTIERRVRVVQPAASLFTTRLTKRMEKVDSLLIAIARGDIEPDGTRAPAAASPSPPQLPASSGQLKVAGSELTEIEDELIEVQDELIEVDEDWLLSDIEPEPFSCK